MARRGVAANSPNDMKVIDVHTHIVPAHIPDERGRGSLWPSVSAIRHDEAVVVIDGKPFRTIDSRCWDTRRRLDDMARENVAIQVLSPMPELLSHWIAPADAEFLSSIVNEAIAGMVAAAPNHFIGLGMIAAQDPGGAGVALRRVADLGLAGIEIGTHINGVPLGDESLWPIYEAAEANDLAIFVHPLHPCGLTRIGKPTEVGIVASFPLEIAMAALSLMGGGVMNHFPKLRILLSHGGGALPSVLGRMEMARKLLPAIDKVLGEDAWQVARRFWYDSNVYDPGTLEVLADRIGIDRLLVGSDYPFLIRQSHPGDFVEKALPSSNEQFCGNARRFLARPRGG